MTDYALIGREKLREIDGEAGVRVEETMKKICPDLARYIVEYSFGEIYAREILDNRTKEQAVVAALTAMGTAAPQLKVHIHAALHVGCTPEEIREVIIQMNGYAGFPATLNAVGTLMEVLKETRQTLSKESVHAGTEGRYERGKEMLAQIAPAQEQVLRETFDPINPDITKYVIEFAYGDIYARGILPIRNRQAATIAALAAMGTAPSQLKFHISGGLRAGLSEAEIVEIMLLVSIYAGFPAALNGILATHEVAKMLQEDL
ncbi:carboxymuconolactone decarboxylase family protein [Methanosphaerula palustris]|uniref:Carboxymuconolactone decarboxylase n=1 Tax=Methanosphaerula palustris (strain ATCC BAA-1556 / DSM 19958 / E1-9c) TaxID=521011 RepID=B8GEP8_METPE|nr:carboxymuconolactone decarboxylase family protein [Methanosphaerula palustris]ACL17749.1 Carboxymuconolactone decarboxylase [Methanosphaerula palustris E1-9c]